MEAGGARSKGRSKLLGIEMEWERKGHLWRERYVIRYPMP